MQPNAVSAPSPGLLEQLGYVRSLPNGLRVLTTEGAHAVSRLLPPTMHYVREGLRFGKTPKVLVALEREVRCEQNREIVRAGKCPDCGSPLKRNNSLAGWWQCVAYAVPYMREAQYRALPNCSFQCFTE